MVEEEKGWTWLCRGMKGSRFGTCEVMALLVRLGNDGSFRIWVDGRIWAWMVQHED